MNEFDEYFNLNVSRKATYIKNNKTLERNESYTNGIYESISNDLGLVFTSLNISPKKFGYRYWQDAVYLYIESDLPQVSICKDIYPNIAKKYGKTTSSIERAMRLSFEDAMYYCNRSRDDIITKYMKNTLIYPHNSEIMAKLAELICSKEFQNSKINFLKSFNN